VTQAFISSRPAPPARPPALRFGENDAAFDCWGMNCGPAALCALLGLTPAEVRPHMQDFEAKGYTNPTMMAAALRSLGVKFTTTLAPLGERQLEWPRFGLARIQWGGPWTQPGVPIQARYRMTHWVASWRDDACDQIFVGPDGKRAGGTHQVFDVNSVALGGWYPFAGWRDDVVPWLLKELYKRADGTWWITHAIEVANGGRRGA